MHKKKSTAWIALILGVVLLFISYYIQGQVAQGREQISSAQQTLDTTNSLFSLSPATKGVGDRLTGGVQKKIDAGSQEATYYANIALILKIGGVALIVIGGYLFFRASKR